MLRSLTRSQNALEIVIQIAESTKPLSLHTAATKAGISLSYCEQLAAKLKKAGIIQSTRGPGGGYSIKQGRKANDILVADVVKAVQPNYQDTMGSKLATVRQLSNILSQAVIDTLLKQPIGKMDSAAT